jgi:folate-dependent phosphoribosylglycinamide formyltransferase PurN
MPLIKGIKMGEKRLKVAILGSTKGTDLEAVFNAVKTGVLEAEIPIVISYRKNA